MNYPNIDIDDATHSAHLITAGFQASLSNALNRASWKTPTQNADQRLRTLLEAMVKACENMVFCGVYKHLCRDDGGSVHDHTQHFLAAMATVFDTREGLFHASMQWQTWVDQHGHNMTIFAMAQMQARMEARAGAPLSQREARNVCVCI